MKKLINLAALTFALVVGATVAVTIPTQSAFADPVGGCSSSGC